ncbi:putative short-chain dehydrogenase [Pseudomassariella vexata]|uniref:Putative short-chain dehydrogenase n=1 Tax=Pseudomassariella vexata TaxID=1141098 RepID=A0A1Y2DQD4_9PEZI|nr:putative short-chain dehydrogenase [Pseudomassariella vexata]ORY61502.1 putative short-chain dehydrogenase [Pseudomassariella vexata]
MGFIYSQLFKRLPYPAESYAGKTVIVTGSNVGLGKEAARHFARLGVSTLILAVRSIEKGTAAKEDIEATTNCAKDVIQVWQLDMASYASVQKFAERVDSELNRVDIFIANAGVARLKYAIVEEDKTTITINVVSTFLLAALVMPKLKATAAQFDTRPTFTITDSEVHARTQLPQKSAPDGELFVTISGKETADKYFEQQYPVSKLLEVFGVRSIAENHPASVSPVTVNCVNPGPCHSELDRDLKTWGFWLKKLLLARSTEYGSRTLVHAGSQGKETHGQYLSDCAVAEPAPLVTSKEGKELQDRLWGELVKKLDGIKLGVTKNF